jgi:hypothetical protein
VVFHRFAFLASVRHYLLDLVLDHALSMVVLPVCVGGSALAFDSLTTTAKTTQKVIMTSCLHSHTPPRALQSAGNAPTAYLNNVCDVCAMPLLRIVVAITLL